MHFRLIMAPFTCFRGPLQPEGGTHVISHPLPTRAEHDSIRRLSSMLRTLSPPQLKASHIPILVLVVLTHAHFVKSPVCLREKKFVITL